MDIAARPARESAPEPTPGSGPPGATPGDAAALYVHEERDAYRARRCARDIARLAGLSGHDRVHLEIAVSELSRALIGPRIPVSITFRIADKPVPALVLTARWAWPPAPGAPSEGEREEIAARVAAFFTVDSPADSTADSTPEAVRATRTVNLPMRPGATVEGIQGRISGQIREHLRTAPPLNALDIAHDQDRDLLAALDALSSEQERLRRATLELEATNRELEETNRGVVALYGELDSAVSKLRSTAHTLQQAMLSDPPSVEGLDICVRYRPAGARDGAEAGGDWYDVFRLADGDLAVVVGDVVGHDTRAAATMGQLRAMLRGLAYHTDDQPHRALETLDRLVRTMALTPFATSVYARLHIGELEPGAPGVVMSWANAGHPGPIVLGPDQASGVLEIPRDIALGVTDGAPRTVCRRWFPAGSTILLFSDGLYERRTEDLDASIAALLERATANGRRPLVELCDTLVDNAPEEDDLVLVALRLGSAVARADHE